MNDITTTENLALAASASVGPTAAPVPDETPVTTHHRICPLCEACCGLEIKTQTKKTAKGRSVQEVISIRGHAADVFSAGYICPKGVALKDLHEDPDRLRTPLIKRNGIHVPATWPEALGEIEKHLLPIISTQGRNAVAITVGNPSAHKVGLLTYFPKLARALGTKNVFSASTLDQIPKQLASGLMYGHWMSIAIPDIARTDYLLVIGANPLASNGSMWTVPDFKGKAKAMQARGGKLVVIDPRRTETAAIADAHHFIRPGADVFLLAAMVNVLVTTDFVALGVLSMSVSGLFEVKTAVREFTPEACAPRCGIAADVIRALALELARTPRAAVYARIGTCTQEYGTLCSWLVDMLNILTGHLDVPGGVMFAKAAAFSSNTATSFFGAVGSSPKTDETLGATQPTSNSAASTQSGNGSGNSGGNGIGVGVGKGISTGRHHSRVSGAPEVMGELPLTCLAEEIETPGEGQIRALFTIATNPVLSSPNGPRLAKALDSLQFMVSMDIYLNETTRHADVILPAPSPLEDFHYDLPFPQMSWRNHARASEPVFAPVNTSDRATQEEWRTLLQLIAIVQGHGASADVDAFDDALFAQDMQRSFGEQAQAVIAATQGLRGPRRLVDVALRSGPYGAGFGSDVSAAPIQTSHPGGLTLAKVLASGAAGGIDLGELQPRIPEMLRTPSGKIELAPPSLIADLQRAATALAQPAPKLVIIGRRDVRTNNSWMHNLPVLAKGPMRCTALVHPHDAARLGLADGALAVIESGFQPTLGIDGNAPLVATATSPGALRSVQALVSVSTEMMPGVVSLPHGWGHDLPGSQLGLAAKRPGANLNALLDENHRDPLSGNAVLSGIPIRMRAVG